LASLTSPPAPGLRPPLQQDEKSETHDFELVEFQTADALTLRGNRTDDGDPTDADGTL
jgi:hypothetical protein